MALYLTYDNQAMQDGLGAQALRIIGIYSIARKYRIRYLHSPILETIEEFAHGIRVEKDLQCLVNRTNELFDLPTYSNVDSFDLEIKVHNLNLRLLVRMLLRYKFSRKSVLLKVCLPFGVMDKDPSSYEHATDYIRKKHGSLFKVSREEQVVVHFRMGYGQTTAVLKHVKPRFLPLDYFISAIQKMSEMKLSSQIKKLIIHTDLSNTKTLWAPSKKRLEQNISFGEKIVDGKVLVPKNDVLMMFSSIHGFDLEIKYCADFFETFFDMVNADVLIISRSAFSYLAALFNTNLVIYPSSHGHAKLDYWLSSNSLGLDQTYELIPG